MDHRISAESPHTSQLLSPAASGAEDPGLSCRSPERAIAATSLQALVPTSSQGKSALAPTRAPAQVPPTVAGETVGVATSNRTSLPVDQQRELLRLEISIFTMTVTCERKREQNSSLNDSSLRDLSRVLRDLEERFDCAELPVRFDTSKGRDRQTQLTLDPPRTS